VLHFLTTLRRHPIKRETIRYEACELATLTSPYPEHVEPDDVDAMAALGLKLPRWATLESDILADFAEEPPYGIRWWTP